MLISNLKCISPSDWRKASASWQMARGVRTISSTPKRTACGPVTTLWVGTTRASRKVTWRSSLTSTTLETSRLWRYGRVWKYYEAALNLNNLKRTYRRSTATTCSVEASGFSDKSPATSDQAQNGRPTRWPTDLTPTGSAKTHVSSRCLSETARPVPSNVGSTLATCGCCLAR